MLKDLLNLHKGDIISIVGSGGKTTTMFKLADELVGNRVLLTTSTKILKEYGGKFITIDDISQIKESLEKNIYLTGKCFTEYKFSGISNSDLNRVKKYFDYIIIEADGSKTLPLKGWRDNEPVILNSSNKTLGIIPMDVYKVELGKIEIFQRELFFSLVGSNKRIFDTECIFKLINSPVGLFKNTTKEKYILFNKCDNMEMVNICKEVVDDLTHKYNIDKNIKFICGSSLKGKYYGC
ncbi:selenium cofactor biosynthesis protein YqeC [Miniphocaeibacter halophilus]|uniref:Selenium-dependent hydroxylase accessory protein YqeC n=1 Tax=Miniphocaeibacter halophilus TaxID=2931922 RepID=A0AC61MTJ9_9FIRM|nr:selenium cofactor biosynthesis protein YqeC [Miniphocaeibacter halophilus]QQK07965.1 putative selenium-dependent hydroxylase accessory protein YqeC [Miniphocaeibacter halophilus]